MHRPWHLGLTGSPQQYARAFLQTLAVALSLSAAGGAFHLPRQWERLRIGPHVAILDCQISDDLMVVLFRETPYECAERSTTRLVEHDLSTNETTALEFEANRQPTCFTVSPERKFLIVGDDDGAVHFIGRSFSSPRGGLVGRHLRGSPASLALSPDQRTLVSLGKSGMYVWELEDWDIRWCRIKEHAALGVIVPPSPTIVCYTIDGERGLLREFDLQSGRELQLIAEDIDRLVGLTVAPDGRRLAGIRGDGVVMLWDRDGHSGPWKSCIVPELPVGKFCVVPAFSPHSDLLAIGHPDGRQLVVWDLRQGRVHRQINTATDTIVGCQFRNQRRLVTWDLAGQIVEWNLDDPSLSRPLTLADRGAR